MNLRTPKDKIQPNPICLKKLETDLPNHTSSRKLTAVQTNWTVCDPKTKIQRVYRKQGVDQLSEADYVITNTRSFQGESQVYIFEDNEVVIKMIITGWSPTMRLVSRTHRAALDWLFERINLDPKIQIGYVDTENPTCWHRNRRKFLEKWVESFSVFIHHHVFFRHILTAIWKVLSLKPESALWLVSCRNEDKTQTRVMGLRWQKSDPPICDARSVQRECFVTRIGISSQSGKRIQQENSWPSHGKPVSSSSNAEVGSSQVYQQEMVILAARKLGQKDLTRLKSEEDSPSKDQNLAVSPEMENMKLHSSHIAWRTAPTQTSQKMKFSDYLYVEKIFQCIQKKQGKTSINVTFSVDSFKNNVLTWRMFMTSSMEAAIHLGQDFWRSRKFFRIHHSWTWRMCSTSLKSKKEHSEEILKWKPWIIIHPHGRDQHCSTTTWSSVGEGKSLCLRRFSSMCG